MRPWACFSSTDINNDNELDIKELKTLIWLMEGEEPDDKRVQKDLKLIDEDKGGTIDRIEWINYLVTPPVAADGESEFDFNLKNSFDMYDLNHDGNIDLYEFK